MQRIKVFAIVAVVSTFGLTPRAHMQSITTEGAASFTATEAPAGFDNLTNGHIDQATFDANSETFSDVETIADGLGPVFNMTSCVGCHGNPVVGGTSPVTEERAGHFNGSVFVDHPGGSLINSQAINAAITEQVLDGNEVRTFRTSLPILGDGFVEATANDTFTTIRNGQPAGFQGKIIMVPVSEASGILRVGRFGWKNQQASLLTFSSDAYLNEMGITSVVGEDCAGTHCNDFVTENTSNGNSVAAFDAVPDPEDDGDDITAFAQFMRATKVPPRGPITAAVNAGANLFAQGACTFCHTPSITTAPAGTLINGGALTVSAALGNKTYHPYGDFMLHDVGTGDGIVQNGGQATRNMVRTMPLWGLRTRNRFMHDGLTFTLNDAILRHGGVGGTFSANFYRQISPNDKANLIAFLRSL